MYDAEERIGEKPNHRRQKQIQLYLILQGKDGTLYSITALRPNSFRWKDLKKALHLIPSRHSVSVRQNSSSNPKTPGSTTYSQVWTWEERSMNSECGSDQRTSRIESYEWFRRVWRSVSETHASGNRETQTKDPSSQAMLSPDEKAKMEKEWKEVMKKVHKNKRLGKSNLLHWWTSATSKSRSTSRRMFARAIWSVEMMKIKIGTIINEVVHGCHQWKVTRMNSKSSSSTSTIIEHFGMSFLNSDKSWIMNYGSSLREKEENFDNLCCESSQPTVEYQEVRLTRFEQRWNEDESSSVHRETVASTMRVKPGLLEKQQRQQQRQQQSYVKNNVKIQKRKESFEKTKN